MYAIGSHFNASFAFLETRLIGSVYKLYMLCNMYEPSIFLLLIVFLRLPLSPHAVLFNFFIFTLSLIYSFMRIYSSLYWQPIYYLLFLCLQSQSLLPQLVSYRAAYFLSYSTSTSNLFWVLFHSLRHCVNLAFFNWCHGSMGNNISS